MNLKIFYRILFIISFFFPYAIFANKVFIEGSVSSSDDKPVKKAEVQLLDATKKKILSIKTDKNGYFKTDEFDAQNCYLQIDKKKELDKMIFVETSKQLDKFSNIFYNKIKLNSEISEF